MNMSSYPGAPRPPPVGGWKTSLSGSNLSNGFGGSNLAPCGKLKEEVKLNKTEKTGIMFSYGWFGNRPCGPPKSGRNGWRGLKSMPPPPRPSGSKSLCTERRLHWIWIKFENKPFLPATDIKKRVPTIVDQPARKQWSSRQIWLDEQWWRVSAGQLGFLLLQNRIQQFISHSLDKRGAVFDEVIERPAWGGNHDLSCV